MRKIPNSTFQLAGHRWVRPSSLLLCLLFLVSNSSRTIGQGARLGQGASMEVLGVGTASLIGGDLTDPENDGNEAAGELDPSWNWKSVSSSAEPGFGGGEFSYNVFDNVGQGGGNNKWCCGEPSTGSTVGANPLQITVELNDVYRLTHFTITSGNDTPGRDPKDWQILGSNDGITFEPIFTHVGEGDTAAASLWGTVRDQVNKFTLTAPARAYRHIRFECTATYITAAGAFFQITEIEYFGLRGPAELTEETVGIGNAALLKGDLTDPDNNGNEAVGPTDASWNWKAVTSSNKPAFGADGAFNVFDNQTGGSTNKWCCDDATAANPQTVTVEFAQPAVISHFTITSADDNPDGDPTKFQILGSNDGVNFTPFYTRDKTTSLWTARNQVARITLKDPSPPSKFIRYQATETPGSIHQIAEIEYFGKFGGLSNPGVPGVLQAASFVQVRVVDGTDTILDPATVRLLVDGTNVTYNLSKAGTATSVTYTRTPLYASASTHTYVFTAKDNFGNDVIRSGSFTTPAYTTIAAAFSLASVDTTKPGFKMKLFQMDFNRHPGTGVVPNAERQIAGGYNDPATGQPVLNTADLSAADADGFFTEPTTINYNEGAPAAGGSFSAASTPPQEDRLIPGIPGGNGTDRYVQSIETILELKAGLYRFAVNSDDGFRLSFGRGSGDVIGTQLATAGDRGFTESTADVAIPVDGFYPVRLMWWETGGGSGAEFYSIDIATGVRTLINDLTSAAGIKAYRESPVSRPYVSRVLPTVGYQYAFADEDLVVDITDGGIAVAPASIRLLLNTAAVSVTPTKAGKVTTLRRVGSLNNLLPAGVNTVNVIYGFTEGGSTVTVTNTYTYTVPSYTNPIPPGNRVTAAQVSGDGFRVRVHQLDRSKDANQGNGGRHTGQNMPGPEIQLNNGYINPLDNLPFPNLANLAGFGADGTLELPGVLNFNVPSLLDPSIVTAGTGIFQAGSDAVFPGLPGKGTSPAAPAAPVAATQAVGTDNFVAEFTTHLDLKAGAHVFGLNVDDAWVAYSSPNARDTLGTLLGFRNAPGGNAGLPLNLANAAFNVIVQEDGIYPLRILFAQGGGGINIEFLTLDRSSGQHVLVNDTAAGFPPTTAGASVASPIKAYSTYTGPARPWVKSSVYPFPHIGTARPLNSSGGAPTLWQNRDQQSGPGPITRKLGLLNGSWNSGEVQNSSTAQRPFGDSVGAVIANLGTGTVGMVLDGANVTPTVTDVQGTTDKLVLYAPPTPLSSSSNHVAGLVYAGTTNYWIFNVITNVSVGASNALASSAADQTARGFRVKVVQSATARAGGNTANAAEIHLAGTPTNVVAPGPGPNGSYLVSGIINWSSRKVPGQTGAEIGNFQTLMGGPADDPIPGLPGTGLTGTAAKDNAAAEIFAYLDLPAGYQKFGVNGDDGWKVQIGTPGQTNGPILFSIDRGAGAQDIPFAFITPQAGLYPVRLVWYQGGGDGNLEFFTYGPNNEKIPVNANHASAVKAYYNAAGGGPGPGPGPGPGTGPTIGIATGAGGNFLIIYTGTLQSTDSLSPPNWQNVASATSPFTVAPTGGAQRYYRVITP